MPLAPVMAIEPARKWLIHSCRCALRRSGSKCRCANNGHHIWNRERSTLFCVRPRKGGVGHDRRPNLSRAARVRALGCGWRSRNGGIRRARTEQNHRDIDEMKRVRQQDTKPQGPRMSGCVPKTLWCNRGSDRPRWIRRPHDVKSRGKTVEAGPLSPTRRVDFQPRRTSEGLDEGSESWSYPTLCFRTSPAV